MVQSSETIIEWVSVADGSYMPRSPTSHLVRHRQKCVIGRGSFCLRDGSRDGLPERRLSGWCGPRPPAYPALVRTLDDVRRRDPQSPQRLRQFARRPEQRTIDQSAAAPIRELNHRCKARRKPQGCLEVELG